MTVEQKIAYRQLVSDILLYMSEKGRSESEILEVQAKLEKAIENLISGIVAIIVPGAQKFYISIKQKIEFRKAVAQTLIRIGKASCRPEQVLELIDNLELWAENRLEEYTRLSMGRAKMKITRLPTEKGFSPN